MTGQGDMSSTVGAACMHSISVYSRLCGAAWQLCQACQPRGAAPYSRWRSPARRADAPSSTFSLYSGDSQCFLVAAANAFWRWASDSAFSSGVMASICGAAGGGVLWVRGGAVVEVGVGSKVWGGQVWGGSM